LRLEALSLGFEARSLSLSKGQVVKQVASTGAATGCRSALTGGLMTALVEPTAPPESAVKQVASTV
jgi:hypothetical protein